MMARATTAANKATTERRLPQTPVMHRIAAVCFVVAGCGRFEFAPVADAVVTDSEGCPPSYQVSLPSSTSRYRVISENQLMRVHYDACKGDATVGTHIVALDDLTEMTELDDVLQGVPAPMFGRFYVGVVQLAGSSTVAAGWIDITGRSHDPTLWKPGEPDDGDGTENAVEQLAVIGPTGQLADVSGGTPYGAICECDGLPSSATAEATIP